jgi:23S rRNA (adenine2503-C2)-methyltransferase
MPFSKKFPLEDLIDSLKYWYTVTKKKILYEYIIFDGINDNLEHIKALVKICKVLPCKVNFIEYNPTGDEIFRQSKIENLQQYQKFLTNEGIVNTFRISRGRDIKAACGQLINFNKIGL